MKQILRRYGQPFEFSEFPWHILRHIFLPQDNKTIKKTATSFSPLAADHSQRFFSAISHVRNKRFQLPLTADHSQRFFSAISHARNKRLQLPMNSQSALRPKSGRSEHKLVRLWIRPNFSGST